MWSCHEKIAIGHGHVGSRFRGKDETRLASSIRKMSQRPSFGGLRAKARVVAGLRMPGLLLIQERASAREILESIENIAFYGLEG